MARRLAPLVLAVTLGVSAVARAHVTPSIDDNNRFLKVTPMGDRVRIAYTVFFGDTPGRTERGGIDTDHDGRISEAEGHAFGERISADVIGGLDVELDGVGTKLVWAEVDVGMGSPQVSAGSFSIDLVAYPCLGKPRGKHELKIHDRFRIPRPGELEVKVEDSPGVAIERARVGQADDASFDYKFVGPGGPMTDDGLVVVFAAGDAAPVGADGECKTPEVPNGKPASSRTLLVGAIGGGAAAAVIVLLVVWRARSRARTKPRKRR